jgi:hypothetical protein
MTSARSPVGDAVELCEATMSLTTNASRLLQLQAICTTLRHVHSKIYTLALTGICTHSRELRVGLEFWAATPSDPLQPNEFDRSLSRACSILAVV